MPGGDYRPKQSVSSFHISSSRIWLGWNHGTCCWGAASLEGRAFLKEGSLSIHEAQSVFSGRPHRGHDNHNGFLGRES